MRSGYAALTCRVLATMLGGCAPPSGSSPSVATESRAPAATWEEEWERTLATARQEGEVVVVASPSAEERRGYTEDFQKKYGIRVTYVGVRGNEASARIVAEREAGIFGIDIYIGGGTTPMSIFKPSGYLQPVGPLLILPDVKDESKWASGRFIYSDPGEDIVFLFNIDAHQPFTINTDLLRSGELTSLQDLLRPSLKGKIGLADPRSGGPGQGNWAYWHDTLGEPFLRALLAQDFFITTDRRTLTDRVARGALAIAFGTDQPYANELAERGLPIKVEPTIPKEGTWLTPGGGALVAFNNAPHPNAQKVYLNWLLSQEGMEYHCAAGLRPCLRTDIKRSPDASASLADLVTRGIPYIEYYTPDGEERQSRAVELAKRMIQ